MEADVAAQRQHLDVPAVGETVDLQMRATFGLELPHQQKADAVAAAAAEVA